MNDVTAAPHAFEQKYCSGCGIVIHKQAQFCPRCGAPQGVIPQQVHHPVRAASPGEKSKVAAILLAFFLGGFGVHKFYLGRVAWGIVYLLFFWTFVPAIIALVEMIVYICMSDEDFHRKYG